MCSCRWVQTRLAASIRSGLEQANRYDFAQALETMGVHEAEADRLAYECGRSVTIFHRRRRAAHIQAPAWRREPYLLPAILAGRWDRSNDQDRSAVVKLAGLETYEELEARLKALVRTSDPPLPRVGDIYTLVAPADAFEICGEFINPPHLERFAEVVREVFAEIDPALDLSPERRPYAAMYGQSPRHSRWLRHGLAESLLLIAVRGTAAELDCNDPQAFVNRLIRALPGLATDRRLAISIESELPVLMEAAPMPFLEALEQMLEGHSEEMRGLLTEEAYPLSGTSAKHVTLLWGLEALAWDPALLPRVALILANMAELDPGGKWANRPINSLRSILLPWLPCTHASLDQRITVLDLILDRHPNEGWALLLKLLPKLHDSSSQSHRPRWRDAGEAHATALTHDVEHSAQTAVVTRTLARVGASVERWRDVLEHLPAFLPSERGRALILLDEAGTTLMDATERERLWALVSELVRRHRALREADWTLKGHELDDWAKLAERLSPSDLVKRHLWAFDNAWADFVAEPELSPGEARESGQRAIVADVLEQYGLDGVKKLLVSVKQPGLVLKPLIQIIDDINQVVKLAEMADSLSNPPHYLSILSYSALQHFGDNWRREVRSLFGRADWSTENRAALLAHWPFEPATWSLTVSGAFSPRCALPAELVKVAGWCPACCCERRRRR